MTWEWSHKAGRPRRNRVTVYQRAKGNIMIYFYHQGERVERSLRHKDRTRAVGQAEETAARILDRLPDRTTTTERMAMLADLKRVAAMRDAPEGYGPPRELYLEEGRYSEALVRTAHIGYYEGNPIEAWGDALARFGLKPWQETRLITIKRLMDDLRKVAAGAGDVTRMPTQREYEENGRWGFRSVLDAMELSSWVDLADMAGLDVEPWRRGLSERMERRHEERAA